MKDKVYKIIRYKTKEILAIIILLLLTFIISSNIKYSKERGFEWIPSIKVDIEVKK